MKAKQLFLTLLAATILCMCEKEATNINEWINGTWVSDQNDTILIDNYLTINSSFPYFYNLRDDSLIISQTTSSDFTQYQSYYYQPNFEKNQLAIFGILGSHKIIFLKQNN